MAAAPVAAALAEWARGMGLAAVRHPILGFYVAAVATTGAVVAAFLL